MRVYITIFALVVLTILLPAKILSDFFEGLGGDLTRTGAYSERDFGWNSVQPLVKINSNQINPNRANILVLGDSYSMYNIWQTVATQKSQQLTTTFRHSNKGCIEDWIQYAADHPTADTVVIETVERAFLDRLSSHHKHCSPFPLTPIEDEKLLPQIGQVRNKTATEFHIVHTFKVAFNTLKVAFNNGAFQGYVVNAPLKINCARVSNRRNDRILYYGRDTQKSRWTYHEIKNATENILKFQKILSKRGKHLIVVVVPDKLSIYSECIPNTVEMFDVTSFLIQSGINAPNLIAEFRKARSKVTDLYLPDDTHLSTRGFILMGELLAPYFNLPI